MKNLTELIDDVNYEKIQSKEALIDINNIDKAEALFLFTEIEKRLSSNPLYLPIKNALIGAAQALSEKGFEPPENAIKITKELNARIPVSTVNQVIKMFMGAIPGAKAITMDSLYIPGEGFIVSHEETFDSSNSSGREDFDGFRKGFVGFISEEDVISLTEIARDAKDKGYHSIDMESPVKLLRKPYEPTCDNDFGAEHITIYASMDPKVKLLNRYDDDFVYFDIPVSSLAYVLSDDIAGALAVNEEEESVILEDYEDFYEGEPFASYQWPDTLPDSILKAINAVNQSLQATTNPK